VQATTKQPNCNSVRTVSVLNFPTWELKVALSLVFSHFLILIQRRQATRFSRPSLSLFQSTGSNHWTVTPQIALLLVSVKKKCFLLTLCREGRYFQISGFSGSINTPYEVAVIPSKEHNSFTVYRTLSTYMPSAIRTLTMVHKTRNFTPRTRIPTTHTIHVPPFTVESLFLDPPW